MQQHSLAPSSLSTQCLLIISSSNSRNPYESTLSTHPFSNLLTSSLNACTSRQQSNGRRSFSLRHVTTADRAVSTLSGTSLTSFRVCSLRSRAAISADAVWRLGPVDASVEEEDWEESLATCARSAERRRVSSSWSLRSSAATRDCTCASRSCAREASVCLGRTGSACFLLRLLVLCGASGKVGEREELTSELDCSDSIMSCDTLAGEDLQLRVSRRHPAEAIEIHGGAYPFQTCVGSEPDCLDEFAPILFGLLGVGCLLGGLACRQIWALESFKISRTGRDDVPVLISDMHRY